MKKAKLLKKINNKSAVVAVVGLGYVGLPLLINFLAAGFKSIGLDIDETKINKLKQKKSYIGTVSDDCIEKIDSSQCVFSTSFKILKGADAIIICVPTPLDQYREPDLSYIRNTMASLSPELKTSTPKVLSLESTTYPGTTEEVVLPYIENQGLIAGKDIFLVYSPEREDPGNKGFSTNNIPKICSGLTKNCLEVGVKLYSMALQTVIPVGSIRVAEMTKLLENIHRAVNIGLANEMKVVADKMGIDIFEVIDAASTKPFGFTPYYPGPGLGGHCIPIDPFYLTWKARQYGVHTRFIELAGEVNSSMPEWVVGKIISALNRERKAINGSKILVSGIAYKKNIDDVRESPSIIIMSMLQNLNAEISYHDPHIPVFPKMRNYSFDLNSTPITSESLSHLDCIVIGAEHENVDYDLILEHAKLIIDTRGVYKKISSKNIIKA